jgi:rSAM/selenodomain-associated transferase 1
MAKTAERTGIAIFAKAPVPGYAKTRLAPVLGAKDAAALQAELIERTVATALAAGLGPVSLWCAPDRSHPAFARMAAAHGVRLYDQQGTDLGARMAAAFAALTPERPLLLIGSDCPALTPDHLRVCADALAGGDDAVFLPAEDGGYVLVGLKRPRPDLFAGIAWGRATVMEETRALLRAGRLRWSEPATLWDLDEPGDYRRFQESQGQSGTQGPADMPQSDVRIRIARQDDIAAVSALLAETWHATYDALLGVDKVTDITSSWHSPEALSRQLGAPDTSFLVAERDGQIVGHALANAERQPILLLARLYIRPDHQRRGIGKWLLDTVVGSFPEAQAVRLDVAAANGAALAFYRREGFAPVGEHIEVGLQHVRMEKRLRAWG